jgi:two-component sensor histidine kinase
MGTYPANDPRTELRLTVAAPAQARRWIEDALPVPEDIKDGLLLCLSELVSNSVQHSGMADRGNVTISAWPSDSVIHVEVQDPGVGRIHASTDDEAHFGLRLVDSIADDWGFSSDPTTVWFEIRQP